MRPDISLGHEFAPGRKLSLGTRVARSAASGLLVTAVTNLFLFLGQILIPRLLTRDAYAQFTVSISFVSLLALVADLGMTPMFTRRFASAEEEIALSHADTRGVLFGSALVLRLVMSGLVAVLVVTIGDLIYSGEQVSSMAILLLSLLISSRLLIVRAVGESVMRAKGKYHLVALFALPDAIAFTVLFAVAPHDLTLRGALWIYSLSNVPGFVVLVAWIVRWLRNERVHISFDLSVALALLREALPLILWTAFLTIHAQIDNLLLDKLSTPWEVSSYGASVRLLSAVLPIPMVLASVISPEITRLLQRRDFERSRNFLSISLRLLLVTSTAIAFFLMVASDALAPLIFGAKYTSIGPLLRIMGWMLVPVFLGSLLTEVSVAAGKYRLPMMFAFVLMVGVIVGDVVLIPHYGAQGAIISKCSAVSVGCLLFFVSLRRSEFFDLAIVRKALLQLCAAVVMTMLVYITVASMTQNIIVLLAAVMIVFLGSIAFTRLFSLRECRELVARFRMSQAEGAA